MSRNYGGNFNRTPWQGQRSEIDRGESSGYQTRGRSPFRGRGRGRGKPRPFYEAKTEPPKSEEKPPSGPPLPAHLSKTESEDKNDPLYKEAIFPDPSEELRRRADELNIHTQADGLTLLTNEMFIEGKSTTPGFARRVPESAFAYYVATLTLARMLKVQSRNGYLTTLEEDRFVQGVEMCKLAPPSALTLYLQGIGNTSLPSGREVLFKLLDHEFIESEDDGSIGWFGRVSPETHYLYKSYPCLAVYVRRIVEDILKTDDHQRNVNWNLPDDMQPEEEGALHPNENLLGWKTSQILAQPQIDWLHVAGVDQNFDTEHRTIPLNTALLRAIQIEIGEVRFWKKESCNNDNEKGSRAQVPYNTFDKDGRIEYMQEVQNNSCLRLAGCFSYFGSAFCYRVNHAIYHIEENEDPDAYGYVLNPNWSIYRFEDGQVPDDYQRTVNIFREDEFEQLNHANFQTVWLNLRSRVNRILEKEHFLK